MSRRVLSAPASVGVVLGLFSVVFGCSSNNDNGFMIGATGGSGAVSTGMGGGVAQTTTALPTGTSGGAVGTTATAPGTAVSGGGATGLATGTKPPVTGTGGGIAVSTGVTPSGGAPATATGLPKATAAECGTDLMTLATGTSSNWIANSDKTCGMQGSVYAFDDKTTCGDAAAIKAPCTADATTGAVKCCITGKTVADATDTSWGCGLGFDLAAIDTDKTPYTGPATGVTLKVTGTVGATTAIRYQVATLPGDDDPAPFTELVGTAAVGSIPVKFSSPKCPSWAKACVAPAAAAGYYAVKLQVVSGSGVKTGEAFNVCIEGIVPTP